MTYYNLIIASDHAGFSLKEQIIDNLLSQGKLVLNLGTDNLEKVDYPDYAKPVCEAISEEQAPFGLLICGTGIGMSIAANRNSHIRAALCTNELMAERARLHNDANILVLGSLLTNLNDALKIINKFLTTEFEGGRHITRIAKLG